MQISPAHCCAQMYCMYLGLKSPSGASRHIETPCQGVHCELLQLHPRGNTGWTVLD